jgi:hypothetical protein
MERLLVQVEYTDGFTFSTNDHVPVIFSSKEEFLITLEDTINDNLKQIKDLDQQHDAGQEKFKKLLSHHKKDKNMTEKDKAKLHEQLLDTHKENDEIAEKIKNLRTIMLGGQEFELSSFLANSYEGDERIEYVSLPQVFTLDEYFSHVEKNLNSTPSKPKM